MRFLLSSCALLAACGSAKPASAPADAPTAAEARTARCHAFSEKMVSVGGGLDKLLGMVPEPERAALRTRLVSAVDAACTEDGWPDTLLACGDAATDLQRMNACFDHFDHRMKQGLMRRVRPVDDAIQAAILGTPPAPRITVVDCRTLSEKALSLHRHDHLLAMLPEDKRAALAARLAETQVVACTDDAWPKELFACSDKADSIEALEDCDALLDEKRRKSAEARLGPILTEIEEALQDRAPPAPEPVVAKDRGPVPVPDCDQYVRLLETALACSALSRNMRESLQEGLAGMKRMQPALEDPDVSPDTRQRIGEMCRGTADSVRKDARELGCDLEAGPDSSKAAKGKKSTRKPKAKK